MFLALLSDLLLQSHSHCSIELESILFFETFHTQLTAIMLLSHISDFPSSIEGQVDLGVVARSPPLWLCPFTPTGDAAARLELWKSQVYSAFGKVHSGTGTLFIVGPNSQIV